MSNRNGCYRLSCDFKGSNSLLTRHCRECLDEFVQRITRLEIVKETLERDPCTDKHGSSTHELGIGVNNVADVPYALFYSPYSSTAADDRTASATACSAAIADSSSSVIRRAMAAAHQTSCSTRQEPRSGVPLRLFGSKRSAAYRPARPVGRQ